MTLARTFPIRLAPLPGEALDSWLEALAHRLNAPLGDVLDDLGLAAPARNGIRDHAVPTDWTIALREEEAARIAHATGADPQQLHDMTLMRFAGRALRIDQDKRKVSRHLLWERPRGCRFCPECLAGATHRRALVRPGFMAPARAASAAVAVTAAFRAGLMSDPTLIRESAARPTPLYVLISGIAFSRACRLKLLHPGVASCRWGCRCAGSVRRG